MGEDESDNYKLERYRTALNLFKYEGRLRWTISGAFLIAETVLLSVLAGILKGCLEQGFSGALLVGGSVIGVLVALLWWATFFRYTRYYSLRIWQARAEESEIDMPLLKEGEEFGNGTIPDRLRQRTGKLKAPSPVMQCLKGRYAVSALIISFIILFGLVGLIGAGVVSI